MTKLSDRIMAVLFASTLVLLAFMLAAPPAKAANCSSYPYTLTNGQVADATQVMANFNNILTCANGNLAHNGANSDITSLSGLSTPLSASQGGTGQATSIFSTANTWATTQTFATPTTSIASINLPAGVAPSSPSNGDIWATSTGVFAQVGGAAVLLNEPGVVHVRHQRTTGLDNNESSFGSSSWNTRTLETVVTNTISGASLASNKITLPAGTYEAQVFTNVCFSAVNHYKNRLYNVTDAATLVLGQAYSTAGGDGAQPASTYGPLIGQFTLTGSKDVRLDTYSTSIGSTNCSAIGDGSAEIYTDVYIRKIG